MRRIAAELRGIEHFVSSSSSRVSCWPSITLNADADTNIEESGPNDIEGGLGRMQVRSRDVVWFGTATHFIRAVRPLRLRTK